MNKHKYIKPEAIIVTYDTDYGVLISNSPTIDDAPGYHGGLGAKFGESDETEY
jgi:hypothetical protein